LGDFKEEMIVVRHNVVVMQTDVITFHIKVH